MSNSKEIKKIEIEKGLKNLHDQLKIFSIETLKNWLPKESNYFINCNLFINNIFEKLEENVEFNQKVKKIEKNIEEEEDKSIIKENIELMEELQKEIDKINKRFNGEEYNEIFDMIEKEILDPEKNNNKYKKYKQKANLLNEHLQKYDDYQYSYNEKINEIIIESRENLKTIKEELLKKMVNMDTVVKNFETITSYPEIFEIDFKYLFN